MVTELAFRKHCKSFDDLIEFCDNSRYFELFKIPNNEVEDEV